MSVAYGAYQLAEYIRGLRGFELRQTYVSTHAGEVLANAILQAGLNFRTVVLPRLVRIRTLFPSGSSVVGFHGILCSFGPQYVLNWNDEVKPKRLMRLVELLIQHEIDSVEHINVWLQETSSREAVLKLPGIGPKTVDYLHAIAGGSCVAIDRHVRSFVGKAGVSVYGYHDTKKVVEYAADILSVKRGILDYSIWHHESKLV